MKVDMTWLVVSAAYGLFALTGCSKSPYEMAAVKGVVKIDGKPFTEGSVIFTPIAQGDLKRVGKPAYGELMPDGSFSLSTYDLQDGAVVGTHRASISSDADEQYTFDAEGKRVLAQTNATFGFLELFDRTYEVKSEEDNEFEIDLTGEYIKKHGQWDD